MHSLAWPVSHLRLSSLATDTFTKPALKLDPWSFNRERAGASQHPKESSSMKCNSFLWQVFVQLCVAFLFTWIDAAQVFL